MRRTLALFACTALFASLALAEQWTGKLLDSACYDRQNPQGAKGGQQSTPQKDTQQQPTTPQAQQPKAGQSAQSSACAATSETTMFALAVDGKVYKLDATGNSQAMAALRNRADRSAPGKQQAADITARVEGTETGGSIRVDKIELQ